MKTHLTLDLVPPELRAAQTRPLFVMTVAVGAIHPAGGPAGAERRVSDITGGAISGDRLSGAALPGGTDWQTIRDDNAALLDARIVNRTDDDALIAMLNRIMAVGIGHRRAEGPVYSIFELL